MNKPIAIVGQACKLPGADTPTEFWSNLNQNITNVTEVPADRWSWRKYFGPTDQPNKTHSKWLGAVDDVDAFDFEFFSIPRPIAELMDPQQRFALQVTHACVEDACIAPSSLWGKRVGVFFAVFNHDYKELMERSGIPVNEHYATGTAAAAISGGVAHHFGFTGPSLTVDTACSGSLEAVDIAIQSLRAGKSDIAIAGGISLILTPSRNISFGKKGMLAPTLGCKAFDDSADGYVRSEGIVEFLLMPLEKAIAGNYPIHSVIKGSATGHCAGEGRTATHPVPAAQARVIVDAHRDAGFPVQSISAIEAHGTGTPIGDPREAEGWKIAFERLADEQGVSVPSNNCGIVSAKPKIGHAEPAAGAAGMLSASLSTENKVLTALYGFQKLNHRINFTGTPFKIIDSNQHWQPPLDEHGKPYPRRIGVSSMGFAGNNAHVAMEEAPQIERPLSESLPCYLICLSAKTETALANIRKHLLAWLQQNEGNTDLLSISYVLLIERDHYPHRDAYCIKDIPTLEQNLQAVIESGLDHHHTLDSVFGYASGYINEGDVPAQGKAQELPQQPQLKKALQVPPNITPKEYEKVINALAAKYVSGEDQDWEVLFKDQPISPLHLPTYAFDKPRCWFTDSDAAKQTMATQSGRLHPLLHQNTSSVLETRFSSRFQGSEDFLETLNAEITLPGLTSLEMIREGLSHAQDSGLQNGTACNSIYLKNIYWLDPITVNPQAAPLSLGVFPAEKSSVSPGAELTFEIYREYKTEADTKTTVYCYGEVMSSAQAEEQKHGLDLKAIQASCKKHETNITNSRITAWYSDLSHILVQLSAEESTDQDGWGLTSNAFTVAKELFKDLLPDEALRLGYIQSMQPSALQTLHITDTHNPICWIWIRGTEEKTAVTKANDESRTVDMDWCDTQGKVCVQFQGLKLQPVMVANAAPIEKNEDDSVEQATQITVEDRQSLEAKLSTDLIQLVSQAIQYDANKITSSDDLFKNLGLESSLLMGIVKQMNKRYGTKLKAARIFNKPKICDITTNLLDKFGSQVEAYFSKQDNTAHPSITTAQHKSSQAGAKQASTTFSGYRQRFLAAQRAIADRPDSSNQEGQKPVAIIGLSVRAPGSEGIEEFWQNLLAAKDCTSDVPLFRWDKDVYFGDPKKPGNKTQVKRGGFIDNIEYFDNKFFDILPRKARGMDPQQRLALEYAWKAFENAGYSAQRLKNSNTAVYVGCTSNDYSSPLMPREIDAYNVTNRSPAIIANYISWFMDFRGASNALDTGCSSSLVAINKAIADINSGRSTLALAGGVHLNAIPEAFVLRDKASMLAGDGRCRTFSEQADGYGPGEGVCFFILKDLKQAEQDGDSIYAVLRSCEEGHGGASKSLTAPNPEAQTQLIKDTYLKANISAGRIGYIEAHCIATPIGDPVETDALADAMKIVGQTQGTQIENTHIGVGSIKSNIGHSEIAAGAFGILKVLLQMQHRTLVPSLHCEQINSEIDLEGSGMYIVRDLAPWLPKIDPQGNPWPLIGGISSFGFGGSIAHAIVEEYLPKTNVVTQQRVSADNPACLILSAKNSQALQYRIQDLLADIAQKPLTDKDLPNLCYTLAVGRDSMQQRVGMMVNSIADLEQKLCALVEGKTNITALFQGLVKSDKENTDMPTDTQLADKLLVDKLVIERKTDQLLRLWCEGLEFDWLRLYSELATYQRIPLSSYRFTGKPFWLSRESDNPGSQTISSSVEAVNS